jgi:large conductance mechanosensitive channel
MGRKTKKDKVKEKVKKHLGVIQEFKEFAVKGNMIDLAVGVVIGTAFTGLVKAFVDDLMMPVIGFITAGSDFKHLKFAFGEKSEILYGDFIQNLVNFFLVALAVFIMVKIVNAFRRPKDEEPAPPTEAELLTEIRDLLKDRAADVEE